MSGARPIAFALLLLLSAAGCGQGPDEDAAASQAATTAPDDAPPAYEGHGLVLETRRGGPELCLGTVLESLPPQCDGIPIEGWDWTAVEKEEEAGGTTWGQFRVVGSYDGETFTVHEAGPPGEPAAPSDSIGTPCPEPEGGWTATDPERASREDVVETQHAVSREPDFAGLWVDYYSRPRAGSTEEDPGNIILNVAFTGDLDRHEVELRNMWGGPLCLTRHEHTLKELNEIQREFPADDFDLETLWSDIDVVEGEVLIGVVAIDPETSERIHDRYGQGVKILPALEPVD